jgi:hypothetical protein
LLPLWKKSVHKVDRSCHFQQTTNASHGSNKAL